MVSAPGIERLVVALVRGIHGLNGALRVEVLTDDTSRFEPSSVLRVEGSDRPLTVVWSQPDEPGLLLRFREVRDRSEAEALRNVYLEAVPEAPLPEGHFYWHELLGADVATGDDEHLGVVADVFRAGGAEILAVRGGPRGEVLVPLVRPVVQLLDPGARAVVVDRDALALDEQTTRRPRGRRSSRAGKLPDAEQPPAS